MVKATENPTIMYNETVYDIVSGQIPPDLRAGLERDFTNEEKQKIFVRIHKTIAPSNAKPVALWVFGPSVIQISLTLRLHVGYT